MIKSVFRFGLLLSFVLVLAFFSQAGLQHKFGVGFFEKHLLFCYCFNYILTLLFYIVLYFFKEKKSNQLGFIFLFSSMLKFILFFALIKPLFNSSAGMRSAEFLAFFVPYSISMFLEIFTIIRLINKEELNLPEKLEK